MQYKDLSRHARSKPMLVVLLLLHDFPRLIPHYLPLYRGSTLYLAPNRAQRLPEDASCFQAVLGFQRHHDAL